MDEEKRAKLMKRAKRFADYPQNPYLDAENMFWYESCIPQCQRDDPGAHMWKIVKECGAKWRALSQEERDVYERAYKQQREDYPKKVNEYLVNSEKKIQMRKNASSSAGLVTCT